MSLDLTRIVLSLNERSIPGSTIHRSHRWTTTRSRPRRECRRASRRSPPGTPRWHMARHPYTGSRYSDAAYPEGSALFVTPT